MKHGFSEQLNQFANVLITDFVMSSGPSEAEVVKGFEQS